VLEEYARNSLREVVLKLASLPKSSIDETLLRRGLDPTGIEDAKAVLVLVGFPITPQDVVDYSFTRHGAPLAFGKGRFGDGNFPVFYSALEKETCEEEVRHRVLGEGATVPFARFYQLIACEFSGLVLDLRGKEQDHPELVSQTESGYPFCRALAQTARSSGIDAFHTPSARRDGGICSPCFSKPTLSNPRFVDAPQVTI
jgi:RES domain